MKILVACEYSGIVRDAFAAKGHDAWSCDILPAESKGNHIQDDDLKYLDKDWDMMSAHPPCTYISNAGARFLYPKKKLNKERYKLGLKAKEFFMALYNAPINKICVENPISSKIFELPKHTQTIQPYQYGHPFSGAGTTGIVANKLNRKAILIELNPDYIKIAQNRMDKEFGMFV